MSKMGRVVMAAGQSTYRFQGSFAVGLTCPSTWTFSCRPRRSPSLCWYFFTRQYALDLAWVALVAAMVVVCVLLVVVGKGLW